MTRLVGGVFMGDHWWLGALAALYVFESEWRHAPTLRGSPWMCPECAVAGVHFQRRVGGMRGGPSFYYECVYVSSLWATKIWGQEMNSPTCGTRP